MKNQVEESFCNHSKLTQRKKLKNKQIAYSNNGQRFQESTQLKNFLPVWTKGWMFSEKSYFFQSHLARAKLDYSRL